MHMAMDGRDTRTGTGHRRMRPVHPRKRCFNTAAGQMMMHVTAKDNSHAVARRRRRRIHLVAMARFVNLTYYGVPGADRSASQVFYGTVNSVRKCSKPISLFRLSVKRLAAASRYSRYTR